MAIVKKKEYGKGSVLQSVLWLDKLVKKKKGRGHPRPYSDPGNAGGGHGEKKTGEYVPGPRAIQKMRAKDIEKKI